MKLGVDLNFKPGGLTLHITEVGGNSHVILIYILLLYIITLLNQMTFLKKKLGHGKEK